MKLRDILIVFVKNPEFGQVKTRLAKTVGHTNALKVYRFLLEHTKNVALETPVERQICYSDYIDFEDMFEPREFIKGVQRGADLGLRMKNAFKDNFDDGYKKIVLIGSDCYEINSEIIVDTFFALDKKDLVLGPAKDGGYYLIGMKKPTPFLFKGKNWGEENVFIDTLLDAKKLGLSYHLLPTLSDVDDENDLGPLEELINRNSKTG